MACNQKAKVRKDLGGKWKSQNKLKSKTKNKVKKDPKNFFKKLKKS